MTRDGSFYSRILVYSELCPRNSHVEAQSPNVTIHGHRAFKAVIKVRKGHWVGEGANPIGLVFFF